MCLDGSATIPYESINDDYCDCADGSDEPGTSACPNGKFYCTNAGHIPSYISSKLVNDGVCEPECCDGSDEYDGKIECPNICEKVGAEHRKLAEQLAKKRAEGARIKREYIQHGEKLKIQLESELNRLKNVLESAKIKVSEREVALKKAQEKEEKEEKGKVESTTKDQVRIQKYREKIRTLQEREERLRDQVNTLLDILKNMKKDHNPNYHDMAVKTAIKGYDELVEEYESEMEENMEFDQEGEIDEDEIIEEASQVPEIDMSPPSLSERISDAFLTLYNDFLETFGLSEYVIHKSERQFSKSSSGGKSKEVIAAFDAYDKAEEEKKNIENDLEEINKKLAKDYGTKREFAKLDDECFNHDAGEYTYTVCMFGKATQKSNKDHASTHLGYFKKWIGAESKGDYKYYTAQLYDHGTRCWNGPDRSVKLYLECDTENKILSVTEPEKCEYIIKMTTPAICPENVEGNKNKKSNHEEL
ncbi:glucosidase II beta subunit-like-domain-containing protein [Glomus cerebriforme]|uniref:Glucosidase 2 subunit beta n=1 Tax=Glomus cerebriforme TaxID=658196 RepID=A0A397TU28_9GLOM|nr:glucosidase II beta subunit-like-domain-containing protein [Glomus cerebriforme]